MEQIGANSVSPTSQHADMLRSQSLFIIDQASVIPTHALHAIDCCLHDVTAVDVPFGGKVMLLGRDFRQVLPVVPRVPPAVIIDTCLKKSHLWPLFQQYQIDRKHAHSAWRTTVCIMAPSDGEWHSDSRLGFHQHAW